VNFSRDDFLAGAKDMAPILLAYAPIAALWGAIAAAEQLTPLQALFMSTFVYTGAAQFIAMDLWAHPIPVVTIMLAVFVVNLRHVLMSVSLSRHIVHWPRGRATALLFWLTDEAWAMSERRAAQHSLTTSYYAGLALPIWTVWSIFTLIGNWLGKGIGDATSIGLDFAFSAMFIAVVAGFWKGANTGAVIAASAMAAVLAKIYMQGTWYILAGALAGMAVSLFWPLKDDT
jgi:4-azaleucine resistance transporter AzlC